jgi:hypothetical protein
MIWVTARLPVPVLHAHAGHPTVAGELRLEQHVERCHAAESACDFFDWHLHWFSPAELARNLGETDDDQRPENLTDSALAFCQCEELEWDLSIDLSTEVGMATFSKLVVAVCAGQSCDTRLLRGLWCWYDNPRSMLCAHHFWRC